MKTSYLDVRDEEGFNNPLEDFEEAIGIRFGDRSWLRAALTHPSYWGDFAIPETERLARSYERLEFLGDSVIALSVCTHLFRLYPDHNQGLLSKAKAYLVSRTVLLNVARRINISEYLRIGKGVEETAGRDHSSFMVDCLEALVGAIYMDKGFQTASDFVYEIIKEDFNEILDKGIQDHKTSLQEIVQKKFKCLPRYKLISQTGPEHHKLFKVEVLVDGEKYGEGEGYSKKEAETIAAKQAIMKLE